MARLECLQKQCEMHMQNTHASQRRAHRFHDTDRMEIDAVREPRQ